MIKYKVFNSFGGFSLENEDTKLGYEDIKNVTVSTADGERGYIRIVGSTHIYEQGYSANEDIYKLITLDYEVLSLPDVLEIDAMTNLMFSKIHETEKSPTHSVLVGKILRINGFDGSFNYNNLNFGE